jgi:uncharacterized membrane protein YeiB
MEQRSEAPGPIPLGPVIASERIEALDVVRGFALIGILLMNVEFFNRAQHGIQEGMPVGLTGIDWAASWFVAYFVQGKFWTLFSLLFGMGFAVMLSRAERAQSNFVRPYVRRVGALAVIGASHYLFLWEGDILFSYAVGAGALLILLYGKWRYLLLAMVPLAGLAFIPGFQPAWAIVGALLSLGLCSLFLRSERHITLRGFGIHVFPFWMGLAGVLASIAAIVLWSIPEAPKEPRVPLTAAGVGVILVAILAARYREPAHLRGLRMGITILVFSAVMMIIVGAAQYATADEAAIVPPIASQAVGERSAKIGSEAPNAPSLSAAQGAGADRAKRLAKLQHEIRTEVHTLSQGGYFDAVELRASRFPKKAAGDAGFSTVLAAMFLLGIWFVRSGMIENTRAHLAFFRRLALVGLPVGIGLGVLGSLIEVSRVPGDDHNGFLLARGLAVLGNLPACVGYLGLVVWMLHGNSVFSRVRVLAPFGRMALTHYVLQSVICSLAFYGYGFALWGMGRAWQLVFAVVVLMLQIVLSHFWLARFRFGPLEWFWRGFTYRQIPPMRK